MKRLILFFALLLAIPIVSAQEGHLKLLAVTDEGGNLTGSVADLYLEIQPGKGRVFIETFPLTKTDTQFTTRFAKEVACKYTESDCSGFDFFYTIKADTAIIGGPSAGGATTVLTIALLKNIPLNESVAMTGTINSGDVIGFVSGVKEKMEAAAKANLTKVLIPRGEILYRYENTTTDLGVYGSKLGVKVVEVGDLDEALTEFTGKKFGDGTKEVTIDPSYSKIMSGLADDLCKRNVMLASKARAFDENTNGMLDEANNLTAESKISLTQNKLYSAASQCFSASVKYSQIETLSKHLTSQQISNESLKLLKDVDDFEAQISNKTKETLADLETFLIVGERLSDARQILENPSNETVQDSEDLAYANERFVSAISWSRFFGAGNGKYVLDKEALKTSCIEKISEADERYQYVGSLLPIALDQIKKELEMAKAFAGTQSYEQCLFSASKAKAQADSILSSAYVDKTQVDILLNQKLSAANKVIAKQIGKGHFPILGYSYYEYAQTLRDQPFSALLYAEYSLELSNLDMYFKQQKVIPLQPRNDELKTLFPIALSLFIGIAFGFFIHHLMGKDEQRRPEKPVKVKRRSK